MDLDRHDVTSAAAPGASRLPATGSAAAVRDAARDLARGGRLFVAVVALGFLSVGPLLVFAVDDGLHARERAARHAVVTVHQDVAHGMAAGLGGLDADVYDPWSTPLRLVRTTTAPYFAVVSAGPDRTFATADDVTSAAP
jgi:hypothetical protein